MIHISPENVIPYLRQRHQVPPDEKICVRPLGGGVSNTVLLVEWADDGFVLKQPLSRLSVADTWEIDLSRIFNERDGMQLLGQLLPTGHVPVVRYSDEANFVLTMSRAASPAVSWKEHLLAGCVDLSHARSAGRLLAMMHNRAAGDPRAKTRFADPRIFVEARIDPYFRAAADKNTDLKSILDAEIDRLLATRRTLIHGDYSPKNLMVQPDGKLMMIDFEVVHYGDPAFDAAFCMALMLLGAIQFRRQTSRQLNAVHAFWQAYTQDAQLLRAEQLEATTLSQLGCMLLARIDGKSKVEYITTQETKVFVREVAREIIRGRADTVAQAITWVQQRLGDTGEHKP